MPSFIEEMSFHKSLDTRVYCLEEEVRQLKLSVEEIMKQILLQGDEINANLKAEIENEAS